MKKACIIGSGIAGIALSVRLRTQGLAVEVWEGNSFPGGKLSDLRLGNYRFDRGPSLFTMPWLVEDLFRLCGMVPENHFRYRKIDQMCHYFYPEGLNFILHSDKETQIQDLSGNFNQSEASIRNHLNRSRTMYDALHTVFMERSLHKVSSYLKKDVWKAVMKISKLGLLSTLHNFHHRHLKNPMLVQYFDRFATYNGSDPYQSPATMHIIPHLEHEFGTFLPEGGMQEITNSLYQLALKMGVVFHFEQKVKKIHTENRKVTGIEVDGRKIPADYVISNADIYTTYRNLLSEEWQHEKILRQPKSSSALVFYWGIDKSFPQLGLHNVLFSANYKAEFQHIFKQRTLYHDPTVYINITSKYVPGDAPEGHENWFVMINVMNHEKENWEELKQTARTYIIKKINKLLHIDIEKHITVESCWTPEGISGLTSSYRGALYGNASNNAFSAFLRHPNFSSKIRNLYFCGGSVHPGGGIPLCLLSAKIVSDLISSAR